MRNVLFGASCIKVLETPNTLTHCLVQRRGRENQNNLLFYPFIYIFYLSFSFGIKKISKDNLISRVYKFQVIFLPLQISPTLDGRKRLEGRDFGTLDFPSELLNQTKDFFSKSFPSNQTIRKETFSPWITLPLPKVIIHNLYHNKYISR